MNANKLHDMVHLHLSEKEAELLFGLCGCISTDGKYGLGFNHPPSNGTKTLDAKEVREMVGHAHYALKSCVKSA